MPSSAASSISLLSRLSLDVDSTDKLGTGFTVVRIDVSGNIDRLHTRFEGSGERNFDNIYDILEDEVARNEQTDNSSCTKGLLWLKRCARSPPHTSPTPTLRWRASERERARGACASAGHTAPCHA